MNETTYEIVTLVIRLAVVMIVSILIPWIQGALKDRKIDETVQKAVYTVQQLYYDEPGTERKKHATEIATEILDKAGIKISSAQLSGLIEAAVMELNIAKGKYATGEATK